MKKLTLLLAVLCLHLGMAQEIKFNPRTGDVEMDGFLKSVNDEAKKDLGAFTANVVKTFGMIKTDVDKLLKDMFPGDVYMAAQVAATIGKPVTDVSGAYLKNKDKGWGAIAKEMGIKPGSPEFHKLKKSMKKNGGGNTKGEHTVSDGGGSKGNGKGNGKGKGKK
jgi:hypothetical protein